MRRFPTLIPAPHARRGIARAAFSHPDEGGMRTGMKSAVQTGALGAIVATVGAVLSFAIMYQLTALNRNNASSTFRGFSFGAAPNREAVSRIRTFVARAALRRRLQPPTAHVRVCCRNRQPLCDGFRRRVNRRVCSGLLAGHARRSALCWCARSALARIVGEGSVRERALCSAEGER